MPITTRAATAADMTDCAQVLADAFRDDPLMSAIWPNPQQRHRALPRYFTASLRHFHLPGGGVRVATDPSGVIRSVAVWDPPARWDQPVSTTLRAAPDLLPALTSRTFAAITVRRTLDRHHPHQPEHWYLANIGTAPAHQGHGYATRLITDRLTSAPATPAYLVCTREDNIPYYQRLGFATTETFQLPVGARPTMWAMTVNM
ncbi:GNAT family N-acetyltransferase [Nocardia cyriacigeorgica]|uniref:GNAT family N-acetyltransferase n=1 Tax=Nocardia cyriacigeorgica TaxID=135487 RepID=UPI002158584B|nr:GNAT family N-acetyltransferase [Nocardia cyriacigeorgica]